MEFNLPPVRPAVQHPVYTKIPGIVRRHYKFFQGREPVAGACRNLNHGLGYNDGLHLPVPHDRQIHQGHPFRHYKNAAFPVIPISHVPAGAGTGSKVIFVCITGDQVSVLVFDKPLKILAVFVLPPVVRNPGKGVVFIVKFFLFPADNHRNLIPARRHARIPAGGRRAVFLRPLWLLPFPWFSSVSCVALPVSHGRLAPLFPARLSTFVTFWGGIPFGVLPLARAARGSSAPEAAFLAGAGLQDIPFAGAGVYRCVNGI